jgi:hypothetical protein
MGEQLPALPLDPSSQRTLGSREAGDAASPRETPAFAGVTTVMERSVAAGFARRPFFDVAQGERSLFGRHSSSVRPAPGERQGSGEGTRHD